MDGFEALQTCTRRLIIEDLTARAFVSVKIKICIKTTFACVHLVLFRGWFVVGY
jgi:hypothetical protein